MFRNCKKIKKKKVADYLFIYMCPSGLPTVHGHGRTIKILAATCE